MQCLIETVALLVAVTLLIYYSKIDLITSYVRYIAYEVTHGENLNIMSFIIIEIKNVCLDRVCRWLAEYVYDIDKYG